MNYLWDYSRYTKYKNTNKCGSTEMASVMTDVFWKSENIDKYLDFDKFKKSHWKLVLSQNDTLSDKCPWSEISGTMIADICIANEDMVDKIPNEAWEKLPKSAVQKIACHRKSALVHVNILKYDKPTRYAAISNMPVLLKTYHWKELEFTKAQWESLDKSVEISKYFDNKEEYNKMRMLLKLQGS